MTPEQKERRHKAKLDVMKTVAPSFAGRINASTFVYPQPEYEEKDVMNKDVVTV